MATEGVKSGVFVVRFFQVRCLRDGQKLQSLPLRQGFRWKQQRIDEITTNAK